MEFTAHTLLITLCVLASLDYVLTIFWIYRWNSTPDIRKLKHKLPLKLIEANPIIQSIAEMNKSFGLYVGVTLGYSVVFLIQVSLLALHWIIGLIVCVFLLGAVLLHLFNNLNTTNEHIAKIVVAYDKVRRDNDGKGKIEQLF